MKTSDFDFNLPQTLIAQHPLEKRDESKLLIMDKHTGKCLHKQFYDILDELNSNDVLVMNNTKVIPARLKGIKEDTGALIELLLLKNEGDVWDALTKPAKRIKVGQTISFGGILKATCLEHLGDGIVRYRLSYDGVFYEVLDQLGTMPLPPYIHETLKDRDRYQTVYAKDPGSSAAPTAGLHFTEELLEKIRQKGVTIIEITLHVGLGTFRPMSTEVIEDHIMHEEKYILSEEVTNKLNDAIKKHKRIICVGTTSVRTLESNFKDKFTPGVYHTDIFIYPGYKFKVVDAIITNFHLPKSTLVMLVSAFSKKEYIMHAYQEAILKQYRFFSFGDAMFIK